MCLPAVAAAPLLLGTSIGSSVLGFIGADQQAKSQQRFQNSRYAQNAESALKSYENQLRLGHERVSQEEIAAGDRSRKNAFDADQQVGRARVTSASSGVTGQSAAELVSEFRRIEADNENAIRTNLQWQREQMGEQFKGLHAGTLDRIASATPQPVARPNPLALALSIGGSLLENQVRVNDNLPPGSDPKNTIDAIVGLS